jgi:retron-type reverse transcriptase
MKRISGIYPKIYDFENLYEAYLSARKNKRYRDDVLKFSANLEENLITLQNELIWHTYEVGEYREFLISEPKKRLIMALPFRDRVVQLAIYSQLNPLLDKRYISASYACRKGKGSHAAADKLQYWLCKSGRQNTRLYALKMDISKYFYRVDHAVLLQIIERIIKDKELLELLKLIINSENDKFGLPLSADMADPGETGRLPDIGMPIGNLTSQMFANLYLNELDKYAKQTLHISRYIRYMDDIIILHSDKNYLADVWQKIETFLGERLHLALNRKTSIRPVKDGIEFVGYRIWATHRKLRKSSSKKLKRGLKHIQHAYSLGADIANARNALSSYLGIMKHFNSYSLFIKIFGDWSENGKRGGWFALRRNSEQR